MSGTDYKPNSHRFKEEQKQAAAPPEKKVTKVVKGQVKTRKKNPISKVADVFISEDANNIGSYIVMDVLVPRIKAAIVDIVTDGVNMLFFPAGQRRKSSSNAPYIAYNSISSNGRNSNHRSDSRTRTGYSHDDIVLETRGEAEEVLSRMDELVDQYGVVTVADLYDLVGKTCNYTDNKYGWTNIRNAEPVRVRDGYILKLPKALPIN